MNKSLLSSKKMKGTRIVISALSLKARKVLAVQRVDEIALRDKYKGLSRWKIPFSVCSYLKTVSLFIPKDEDPYRHEILGFKKMSQVHKNNLYLGIKQSFKEGGCSLDDFEVKFYDE